jgi:aminoglycoside phosphotransferase (APT) family kinase protein
MHDPELQSLIDHVVAFDPSLAPACFRKVTQGWDSVVLEADDRLIFKFPRDADGERDLRREASLLALVAGRVSVPVPRMTVVEGARTFSCHERLAGGYLLTDDYAPLPEAARIQLADSIAQFFTELHAIDPREAERAGASPLEPWPSAEELATSIERHLTPKQRSTAKKIIERWQALPPDPYGQVFGHFDTHGWNVAFDHDAMRLNGVYDFGDAGLGPLHQEFVCTSYIDPDLTGRVIAAYEARTGRAIDRDTVALRTGVLRLVDLASDGDHPDFGGWIRSTALDWLDAI